MFVASPPSLPFLRSTVITVFYLSLLVLVGLRGASRRCASGVSFLAADNVVSHQYSKEKGEKKRGLKVKKKKKTHEVVGKCICMCLFSILALI